MVTYQIQYKEKTDIRGCNASEKVPSSGNDQQYAQELKTCFLRNDLKLNKPMISEYTNGGHWRVVAELPTLQAAITATKSLLKKYGYENLQICKVTSLKIEVHAE